jgi:cytosine/adenosine deaminase-related metal-dependent hydrolase
MRKLSAPYIFTGKEIIKNGIVEVDNTNTIVSVRQSAVEGIQEEASLEHYNGVIVPGFVNTHCHLELSHMKGVISNNSGRGLPGFIDEIISKRSFPDDLQEQILKADREMRLGGIVAVGDISNTDDSFSVKLSSDIYYHSFIEVFAVSNEASKELFDKALKNAETCKKMNLQYSIVPHAAYSVPDALQKMIIERNQKKNQIISIHNQETPSEDEMIQNKTGQLAEVLKKKGFQFNDFSFQYNTASEVNLSTVSKDDNTLLIHNTFSKESDIENAEDFSANIYWVFCPLSNLYIEKTVPNVDLFMNKNVKVCIGTDSYASNNKLSILEEIKALSEAYPNITFETFIEWACVNGAKALNIEDRYGSIEIGKQPGLNLITHFDFEKMSITESSKVKALC